MVQSKYKFRIYVVGTTILSKKAIKTLEAALESHFKNQYIIEIIDILENTELAEKDGVYATPTIVKIDPPPVKRIVGVLEDQETVLLKLGLISKKKK